MTESYLASASDPRIGGRTLDEWVALSRRDDCLERMVPSELRELVSVLARAESRRLDMDHKATRDGFPSMIEWIREYRFRTKATLKDSRDAYLAGTAMPSLAISSMGDVHHPPGMTLRDWFAGQALVAIGSNANTVLGDDLDAGLRELVGVAFKTADAMLAERAKAVQS